MKKKILYIHHGKGLGGAPLSLLYLIESLDKTEYEPVVLFLHESDAIDLYKEKNITTLGPVNRYDFPHTKIWWHRWFHVHNFIRTFFDTIMTIVFDGPSWLKKIKPDMIHLNTSSLIAWGIAAHRYKIPVVWHVREPLAAGYLGIRKTIISWIITKYATQIIPISKHDAKPWITKKKTTILHNPVDPLLFYPAINGSQLKKQLQIPSQSPVILFLGGISKEKGTDIIIKAFKQLIKKQPHAHLIIAGSSLLRTHKKTSFKQYLSPSYHYLQYIEKLCNNLRSRIVFTGPSRQVPELIALSNVVVFPASVGHFARPIIEAACMAKPVIASALPPLDELVINNETGYLISPDDIDAWTDCLEKIIINPSLAKNLGTKGYSISKKFHINTYAKKISDLYEKTLKGTHEQSRTT
ncbi:glycosyltransferase family 4 protein [Candidatus Babeliales bacterium]|nr:glycosyltransferase family 4 protein [Candidatus Babeliales bacterium]